MENIWRLCCDMGSYQDGANDDRIVSVNREDPLATQLLFSVFVSRFVLQSVAIVWPCFKSNDMLLIAKF